MSDGWTRRARRPSSRNNHGNMAGPQPLTQDVAGPAGPARFLRGLLSIHSEGNHKVSDPDFRFRPVDLPAHAEKLRQEVRAFVKEALASGLYKVDGRGWARHDRKVSREIGRRGWIGMTWPKAYGGHERTALERYVVTEELLAQGVPMRAHWSADRQNGPLLLEFGSEWQKQTFLPKFAAGEEGCAIGLSEPDSGSDLAGIRTKAVKVEGGWRVNGRKVWTSNVHNVSYMTLLLRTDSADSAQGRHGGMTRFLVDMGWKGITVRPILQMTGEHDFNEVTFDDVFMPDSMVVGEVNGAWKQLGRELAHERSAPDRWTAVLPLLKMTIDRLGSADHRMGSADHRMGSPDHRMGAADQRMDGDADHPLGSADHRMGDSPDRMARQSIGRMAAHLWTLRNMSLSVFGMLERGENPVIEASLVKDLGTHYEQEIPHAVRALLPEGLRAQWPADDQFNAVLHFHLLAAPSITIRGGTREILRNAVARGLGLR